METLHLQLVLSLERQAAASGPAAQESLREKAGIWMLENEIGTLTFEPGVADVLRRVLASD
ncbi:hypothetical protein LGR64_06870 [Delftia sp. Lp-1]|uniref:hypothetical protein n=1 Tax=Delftia TaxID=80865 RepID=UPI0012FE4AC2|nr:MULTISPECIES: hypothetical protein [Delftia]MCB4785988.1 hypothetical protein [Delftia sp. Lp-1]